MKNVEVRRRLLPVGGERVRGISDIPNCRRGIRSLLIIFLPLGQKTRRQTEEDRASDRCVCIQCRKGVTGISGQSWQLAETKIECTYIILVFTD
ncbi:hypothetical protein MTP99_007307 [Tenebrio molitor]|nr:hypothetical protein MTP99_007307 [Tenebrio molitor]